MKKNSWIERNIINLGYKILKLLPIFILRILWNIFDNSEGKLAILFRYLFLKKYCKKIGERVYIGKNVNIKNYKNLSLGTNVSIHSFCYIDAYGDITIGDNVSIANSTSIISSDHTWSDVGLPIKYNKVVRKPIVILNDVWIASGVRILGDIKIKSRTVIGAGAVVTKSLESNSLYLGVPARKIKDLK